jgi:NAD+ kinase
MKKIGLVVNRKKDTDLSVTRRVIEKLMSQGLEIYAELEVKPELSDIKDLNFTDLGEFRCDLIIVLGGDGSVIDASGIAISSDAPILGINLGKVGYLSEVDKDNLSLLDGIPDGKYDIEQKMLLSVRGIEGRYAVNDVVVTHESYLGIGEFKIQDSSGNSISYRADGIIISTPQGSTAYSLSAGGPIIAHGVEGIILTPVAPHSFFNRSVIFNEDDELTVTNVGNGELKVAIDGRYVDKLENGQSLTVKRADRQLKMLTFSQNSMFTTLFKKMRLLEDITL